MVVRCPRGSTASRFASPHAKREFARRRARERVAALPEVDQAVSDEAWESLVAAVHEEVQNLPEAERTAFVLCELQGVPQADAARGWAGRSAPCRGDCVERGRGC